MQPLSTNRATVSPPAGADQPFIAARFACLALATVCFSAAAGLEGSKMNQPLIAALPGTLAAAALAYRAKPALALTPSLTLDDVSIKEAPGKGEGLFARRRIQKGEFVMVRGRRPRLVFRGQRFHPRLMSTQDYLGEEMDDDAVNERYRDLIEARYLLGLRGPLGLDQTWIDAVNPQKSNLGRYINHGRPASLRKVRQRFPDRRLRFFAARDLEPGEELTFDYGDDYWLGREDELRE